MMMGLQDQTDQSDSVSLVKAYNDVEEYAL